MSNDAQKYKVSFIKMTIVISYISQSEVLYEIEKCILNKIPLLNKYFGCDRIKSSRVLNLRHSYSRTLDDSSEKRIRDRCCLVNCVIVQQKIVIGQ